MVVIHKYLSTYAEPDIQALSVSAPEQSCQAVFIVPVYDESLEALLAFLEIPSAKSIVTIWVFNCPDNADEGARSRTRKLMSDVLERFQFDSISDAVYVSQVSAARSLYVLDYCSPGWELSAKQGVGLARKLGMDLGLKLISLSGTANRQSLPWLHSCDADVSLPDDYFDIAAPEPDVAACLYAFQHIPEPGYERAMALYEQSLRYYVERLKWAGSPYAFHTIGSLIAVNPVSYAQVRGIPKRSGAEDFYLLNKLAKVGKIVSLDAPLLTIAGRPSHRVPFGTGPALSKIQAMRDPDREYVYYHPDIFVALKTVLQTVARAEQGFTSLDGFYLLLKREMTPEMAARTCAVLDALNIEKAFLHLLEGAGKKQFARAFNTWFDAFTTLRFIHLMRDLGYHSVPFSEVKL